MTHLESRFRSILDSIKVEKKAHYVDYGIALELARRAHDLAITEAAGAIRSEVPSADGIVAAVLKLRNPEEKKR